MLPFKFFNDVNFLIGINGSGKTTAINLIVAALTADVETLARIDFSKVSIILKEKKGRKKPSIVIRKLINEHSRFPNIEYEIKDSASSPSTSYSLDDYEEHVFFKEHTFPGTGSMRRRRQKLMYHRPISEHIRQLIQVSWLSVHRAPSTSDPELHRFTSIIDQKLEELSNRLVRYLSNLNQEGAKLLEEFQETIFLSLLIDGSRRELFGSHLNEDIDDEKKALIAIFEQFRVDPRKYRRRVDSHFNILAKSEEKLRLAQDLEDIDIAALIGTERIQTVVNEWEKLTDRRNEIYKPRETFLSIINGLMQRKSFSINSRNEVCVTTQSGKPLPLRSLSSGEKQLLIVLGEALLQENEAWLYIADEPELSLHLKWQEKLVDNLRALNPSAQIIFATHSPDVVSSYGDRVFDMENLLA